MPAPMRNAVARSLAKSPDERFQTVQDFNAAFSGAVPAREATAPLAAPPSLPERQRTELGQPLDVAAAFAPQQPIGTPAPMMSPMGPQVMGGAPPGGQVGAYTPAQGNVAYPTPAGFPQPPARESGAGGGRTVLLVVAGILGVASVVAIVFAVRGSGSGNAVQFQNTIPSAAPTTVLTPVATATQTSAPPATGTGEVPPLVGTVHPTAVPPHPTATQPIATATPKYDGPECQRARTMRSLGHPKEAEQWGLRCIAKGGNPN